MKKIWRVAIVTILVLAIVGAAVFYGLFRATQHQPEFYVQALEIEPQVLEVAGDEMEKIVLDLRNEVRRDGEWEASFTDEQINGWLASDLPQSFPEALPPHVSEPRVSLIPDLVQVAFRYHSERFSSVVSLGFSVQLTGQPNEIALRIRRLRAGALPLPAVEQWKQELDRELAGAGVPLKWEKAEGDDVAVISLPVEHEQFNGQRMLLETIQLRDGVVYLSGRTEPVGASKSGAGELKTAESSLSNSATVQR